MFWRSRLIFRFRRYLTIRCWWGWCMPGSTRWRPTSEKDNTQSRISRGQWSSVKSNPLGLQQYFSSPISFFRLPELPYTPGSDAAGYVYRIGNNVSGGLKVIMEIFWLIWKFFVGWRQSICKWKFQQWKLWVLRWVCYLRQHLCLPSSPETFLRPGSLPRRPLLHRVQGADPEGADQARGDGAHPRR